MSDNKVVDKAAKFDYIGRLFINKSANGKVYMKGSVTVDGKTVEVVGFPNEIELKTGKNAGTKVKVISLALSTKKETDF